RQHGKPSRKGGTTLPGSRSSKRLYAAQHQVSLYAHQVDTLKRRATWLEGQLAYAWQRTRAHRPGGDFRIACPDFPAPGPGREDMPGRADHGTQEPAPE